ncbi:MAG TPA: hypothetical protein VGW40_06160 [Allosphingosinicella sp.]|nr:hypothetical protein [Allosphingosinicella sp.]
MSLSREVDYVIGRFDEAKARIPRINAARAGDGWRTDRNWRRWKGAAIFAVVAAGIIWLAATIVGIVLNGIGLEGLGLAVLATAMAIGYAIWRSREKPIVDYKEDMPNKAVVERLDMLLVRKRPALPAPAASRIDAISRQLPLLESRLAETATLDPLAQDARRLMGKHLPELIERYERVPPDYRRERDGEGLTVDDRLVQGLDAAGKALDELGRKLAREDMDAFQTQGRFIESRYKDDEGLRGE